MTGYLQSFEEFSVLWILISAGVGGRIGALVKFIFEQVLATKYRKQVDAKDSRYKEIVQFFFQFIDCIWFEGNGPKPPLLEISHDRVIDIAAGYR